MTEAVVLPSRKGDRTSMSDLRIRIFGDPVLRTKASEVTTFDEALARLADDMMEAMHAASGVGLAANQVGILKQLFTWDDGEGSGAYVNPKVLETSEETETSDEGCLSLPGLFYPTERPLRARIRAANVHGEEIETVGEGLRARIFLHEIDHLNGILFLDHLALHDRKEAMRRIREGELERPPAADHQPPPA